MSLPALQRLQIRMGEAATQGCMDFIEDSIKILQAHYPKARYKPALDYVLSLAVTSNHLGIVKALVTAGASPGGIDKENLYAALSYGNADVAKYLYDQGTVPTQKDPDPLEYAIPAEYHKHHANKMACIKVALDMRHPLRHTNLLSHEQQQLASFGDIDSLSLLRNHPSMKHVRRDTLSSYTTLLTLYEHAPLLLGPLLKLAGYTFPGTATIQLLPKPCNSETTQLLLDHVKSHFPETPPHKLALQVPNTTAAAIWLGHQLGPQSPTPAPQQQPPSVP